MLIIEISIFYICDHILMGVIFNKWAVR